MPRKATAAEDLNELLHRLLPSHEVYETMVDPGDQAERLDVLRKNLSPESFFFVFNLLTCKLESVAGVDMALGYPDKEYTVGQYMGSVHPGQSIQFNMIASSMYKVLCAGVFKLHFIIDSYISLVALRHYNGEYIVFKKTTSVFQFDRQNRLLAQLNEFTRVDVYDHSPLKPRIQEMGGLQKSDFETAVFRLTFQSFAEKKYFSGRELEVLRAYAEHERITTKGLAELLQVEVSTINTYNKRILEKAKEIFTHPFVEAREVALYLKKERIL